MTIPRTARPPTTSRSERIHLTITKITTYAHTLRGSPRRYTHATFYTNAGNGPGTIACDYPFVPNFTGGGTGNFVITLPGACVLPQGTY
jgi:hypothetical protein